MVARRELCSRHLRNGKRNTLALGGHEDDLLVQRDVVLIPQQTGDHQLRAVAHGVDSAIFNDNTFVTD